MVEIYVTRWTERVGRAKRDDFRRHRVGERWRWVVGGGLGEGRGGGYWMGEGRGEREWRGKVGGREWLGDIEEG